MLYFSSLPDYVQIYRTEIILCPRHNDREDSEKLVWSRLCDDFTIQEHGAIRTEDLCHSDPDIMAASSHNKVQLLNVAISE